jgi:Kdo2-lipid IVA lauroyltransferase/acyltransferase
MPRQIGRFRAGVEMAALALPWATLRVLPLERAVRLGAAVGALAPVVDRANRRIAMRNLTIAFPDYDDARRVRVLRDTYRNFGRMAAEWIHFFELERANIERYVSYSGLAYWKEALRISGGRGILILTGHFGNFELLSGAHSVYGNRCAIVQRPNRNPLIDAAVTARRERFGNRAIPRRGAARTALRLLREDWMVAIPLDLDTRNGVFADFFGLPAATSDALARIAMATGAPVLPAFMLREGASPRHRITFLPVIDLVHTEDRASAVRENTQRFTTVIETMVRGHPDHWNWIHRRWKTRPAGEPRIY